jgi:hypothetical protein
MDFFHTVRDLKKSLRPLKSLLILGGLLMFLMVTLFLLD